MNAIRSRAKSLVLALGLVAAVMWLLPTYTATAHGGEENLQVIPNTASAGASVTVTASGFPSNSIVAITLESLQGEVAIADVQASAAGELQTTVVIPAIATAGSWTLAATGGGEKAFNDFTVLEGAMQMPAAESAGDQSSSLASNGSADDSGMAGMPGMAAPAGGSQGAATTLIIQRTNTETIVIGILIGMMVLAGSVMVLVGTRQRGTA